MIPIHTWPLLLLAFFCQGLPAQDSPQILIQPNALLLGDPFSMRLVKLPGTEVVLEAELQSGGRAYRSTATFRVSESGVVDLSTDAPISGDYEGADLLGIFWSMGEVGRAPAQVDPNVSVVTFTLRNGESVLARGRLSRSLVGPGVTVEEVREDGLVATFCSPPGDGPHPGVILVGGSSGGIGWQRTMAKLLASHGYAALGLAYFSFADLPSALEEIPLEYFANAVSWMQDNESVDPSRLAICGVSKGGELALVMGASFPQITAVVAYVPGSAVFQSIAPSWPNTSSWSRDGEGLPFVPYDLQAASSGADLLEIYTESLKNTKAMAVARIPVENTGGPILLISAMDDTIWPSTAMSEDVAAKLKDANHPHEVEHFAYENAGHSISRPAYAAQGELTRNGGTAAGNARASVAAWTRVLAFLKRHLQRN